MCIWIGRALAQDFLKEAGVDNIGKPDVHIIDLFKKLFPHKFKMMQNDVEIVNQIFEEMSQDTSLQIFPFLKNSQGHISVYAIDKLFWLIGSGKFYKYDLYLGSFKPEFFNLLSEQRKNPLSKEAEC